MLTIKRYIHWAYPILVAVFFMVTYSFTFTRFPNAHVYRTTAVYAVERGVTNRASHTYGPGGWFGDAPRYIRDDIRLLGSYEPTIHTFYAYGYICRDVALDTYLRRPIYPYNEWGEKIAFRDNEPAVYLYDTYDKSRIFTDWSDEDETPRVFVRVFGDRGELETCLRESTLELIDDMCTPVSRVPRYPVALVCVQVLGSAKLYFSELAYDYWDKPYLIINEAGGKAIPDMPPVCLNQYFLISPRPGYELNWEKLSIQLVPVE